jgi:hypothetical protein
VETQVLRGGELPSPMVAANQRHPVRRRQEGVEFLAAQTDERLALFRAAFAHEVLLICAEVREEATKLYVRRPENLLGVIHGETSPSPPG